MYRAASPNSHSFTSSILRSCARSSSTLKIVSTAESIGGILSASGNGARRNWISQIKSCGKQEALLRLRRAGLISKDFGRSPSTANFVGIVQVFGVGYHFDAVAALAKRREFSRTRMGRAISRERLFINFCKFSRILEAHIRGYRRRFGLQTGASSVGKLEFGCRKSIA